MSHPDKERELILQVVRGLRPLVDLEEIGIQIRTEDNVHEIDNPHRIVAQARVKYVAQGLLRQQADMAALRAWATMILISPSFLDRADEFEGEATGDALWDISFDGILEDDTVRLAERILDDTTE